MNFKREIELSIVIISYNTRNITRNCLRSIQASLKNSSLKYEVVVIDNASTDGSQTQILKLKAQNQNLKLKTIFNPKNTGFAKANNQAVKQATGEYILFLNSDTIVLNYSIIKLLNYYKNNEHKVHFLGGKLFEKDGITPQPSCGPFYTLPVIFGALFLKGDYWGLTRYSTNKIKEVDWISGACILTKREYLVNLGGFDEKIFMYMDEIDLLYRAKKKGYRVFFYPEAKFIHLASASSNEKTYPIIQVYRGFLYFYKKHHAGSDIFFLKILLKLKALIALFIGKLTNNSYLK